MVISVLPINNLPTNCSGEFEVRFLDIRKDVFFRVKDILDKRENIKSKIHTIDIRYQNGIRITQNDDGTRIAMVKTELFNKVIDEYKIKIACSSEQILKDIPKNLIEKDIVIIRDKTRWTYIF